MKAKKLMKLLGYTYEGVKSRGDMSTVTIKEEHKALVKVTEKIGDKDEVIMIWFFNIIGGDILFWEDGRMEDKTKISCKNFKRLVKVIRSVKRV